MCSLHCPSLVKISQRWSVLQPTGCQIGLTLKLCKIRCQEDDYYKDDNSSGSQPAGTPVRMVVRGVVLLVSVGTLVVATAARIIAQESRSHKWWVTKGGTGGSARGHTYGSETVGTLEVQPGASLTNTLPRCWDRIYVIASILNHGI